MSEQVSRRTFLRGAGLALTAASLGESSRAAEGRLFAYVGRDPRWASFARFKEQSGGGGVDVFRVDMTDGSLQPFSSTGPEVANLYCDGMCVSADGRFLYCIDSTAALQGIPGAGGGLDAFAINRADGSLRHLNTQPSMGAMPTAVRIDKTSSRVIVGNHGAVAKVCLVVERNGVPMIESPTDSATVALFPVQTDGSLESASGISIFAEQPAPGQNSSTFRLGAACHCVAFDRMQRWIIATDNGYDHIYIHPFSPTSRKLQGKAFPTPPGRAPRHIAVHPHAPYFFITNEREPSVSSFHFDSHTGEPRLIQTIATMPGGDTSAPPAHGPGFGSAAGNDIRLHPNGKFLYASTRLLEGRVSMATFAVDEDTGRLTGVDVMEAAGRGQREFNIEPSGRFLFGCNVITNDVIAYALDPDTGKMTQTATTSDMSRPGVIDFATL